MAKRRSKRTRRSKRAVSKRIRINDKKVRRTKRRKRRTKRIKLYGGMDGDGEGDLVPPIVGQQIQDGDEDGDDEAPVIDMTPSDLHGEIRRLESRIDELEEKQKICCSDKDMAAENIQRVYRGHQGRDAFKVTRRSRKPNVTDELLDLPLEVSDLIMAERDKIPMVTQGWIIVKGVYLIPLSEWKMGSVKADEFEAGRVLDFRLRTQGEKKQIIESMGFFGWTAPSDRGQMGQTKWARVLASPTNHRPHYFARSVDDILDKMRHQSVDDIKSREYSTYITPGASFELIRQKIDEGFIIEFEDDEDRARL
jgi:hypothetical protein